MTKKSLKLIVFIAIIFAIAWAYSVFVSPNISKDQYTNTIENTISQKQKLLINMKPDYGVLIYYKDLFAYQNSNITSSEELKILPKIQISKDPSAIFVGAEKYIAKNISVEVQGNSEIIICWLLDGNMVDNYSFLTDEDTNDLNLLITEYDQEKGVFMWSFLFDRQKQIINELKKNIDTNSKK